MIQFLKTKGIAILGVFMVMSMFLMSNVTTAYAWTTQYVSPTEDSIVQMSPTSENWYFLTINKASANLKNLRENTDLRFKVQNSSDVPFEFNVRGDSPLLIQTIGVGESYVFDSDFWNDFYNSLTNSQISTYGTNLLYFCCSEDGSDGSLQLSIAGEEDNVFLSIMNFTVNVGQSLFELAGATVTFIFEHPLALFGLLIGLIYTSILIFRLIIKGV